MIIVCSTCGIGKPATIEYFPIKASKRGLSKVCLECRKVTKDKYRKENRVHILAYKKKYREEHKESIAEEKHREWIDCDKREHKIKICNAWRTNNKELIAVKAKINHTINKERIKEVRQEYGRNNKYKINRFAHERRARKKNLAHTLTEKQWDNIKRNFDNKCAYCGEEKNLAQEHFYPLSLGGEYTKENIICACQTCNSSKGNRLFKDWYNKQNFYSKSREVKLLGYLNYKNNVQQLTLM